MFHVKHISLLLIPGSVKHKGWIFRCCMQEPSMAAEDCEFVRSGFVVI